MKRIVLTTVAALALTGTAALAEVESTDPIKLTLHDWTGQLITTNIMAAVLEEAGYNVELVTGRLPGAIRGPRDPVICMWRWKCGKPPAARRWMPPLQPVASSTWARPAWQAIEEWWYPLYMKEQCPGLPDWQALNDCAEALRHPGDGAEGALSGRSGHLGRL